MAEKISSTTLSRYDLQIISEWIEPNSKVLDLGCGDGSLLKHLQETRSTTGYGLELKPEMIAQCIDKGVNVIQTNLDKGLSHFDSNSFDTVILSLTLQAMRRPRRLLEEMLRVGERGIVTFPNFAYWRNRLQLGLSGKMPVSKQLPHTWYNTPNIHLCTMRDFSKLCDELGFRIEEMRAVAADGSSNLGLRFAPNLFGEIALCRFRKK